MTPNIQAKAEELLRDRLGTAERLGAAADAVDEAQKEYAAAFEAAKRAGWTRGELHRLGVPAPIQPRARRGGGRGRRARETTDVVPAESVSADGSGGE